MFQSLESFNNFISGIDGIIRVSIGLTIFWPLYLQEKISKQQMNKYQSVRKSWKKQRL
jgi:hypothetical protein